MVVAVGLLWCEKQKTIGLQQKHVQRLRERFRRLPQVQMQEACQMAKILKEKIEIANWKNELKVKSRKKIVIIVNFNANYLDTCSP